MYVGNGRCARPTHVRAAPPRKVRSLPSSLRRDAKQALLLSQLQAPPGIKRDGPDCGVQRAERCTPRLGARSADASSASRTSWGTKTRSTAHDDAVTVFGVQGGSTITGRVVAHITQQMP